MFQALLVSATGALVNLPGTGSLAACFAHFIMFAHFTGRLRYQPKTVGKSVAPVRVLGIDNPFFPRVF